MKNGDAKLIQRVLAGDDAAFSILVKKYQKPVHALAWRKIGGFPHRRGDYARHLSESISEIGNAKGATTFFELALCDSDKSLQSVAP